MTKLVLTKLTCDMDTPWHGLPQEQQTNFAVACILELRARHRAANPSSPWHVILIGHSMGGVVARAALAQLSERPDFGEPPACRCRF